MLHSSICRKRQGVLPAAVKANRISLFSRAEKYRCERSEQYHADKVGISLKRVKNMADSILKSKSKEFAKDIVLLCQDIKNNKKESVLTNQLLRAGTSIGANIHEAQYAQGKKDFISKLEIAQKECNETEYWLELLYETGYIEEKRYKPIKNDCGAIRRMLISSITTTKENLKK